MKKSLAVILSLVLCTSCLFGCGGKDSSAKKAAADSDDVVIDVWSTEAGAQETYEELVDEWNSTTGDEKNIFINYVTTTDGTKVDVAQQGGQLPHIFGGSKNQRRKFIQSGDVMAVDDMPGGEEFLKEINLPGTEGENVINGKTYCIYTEVTTCGLAYNKDLFKKAGIVDENGEAKAPTTLEEVREYAKKITALGGGVYGYAFPLAFNLAYLSTAPLSAYYDNNYPDKAYSYIDLDNLTVDNSGYKEMVSWILDMREDGSLFPGSETLDNDTARAYFSSGIIGMIPAMSWDVAVYTEQFPTECDWDICKFPGLSGKEEISQYNNRGGSRLIGKTAAEKNPEETMEVYKFLHSVELQTELFERGIQISTMPEVLEAADKDKVDPRLYKFAEFVEPDKRYASAEKYVLEGDNWATLFEKVWIGDMTLDAAIADLNKRDTEGLRKAVKNGEYDVERQKRVVRYLKGEDGVDITVN